MYLVVFPNIFGSDSKLLVVIPNILGSNSKYIGSDSEYICIGRALLWLHCTCIYLVVIPNILVAIPNIFCIGWALLWLHCT